MNKALTLSQRCSSKMLTEQLTQQQLYIRLIGKVFKLLTSLERLSNLLNLSTPLSTLSNFAETRMDKGLHKVAHMSNLIEQLGADVCMPTAKKVLTFSPTCGCTNREKRADVLHPLTSFLRGGS